MYIQLEVKYPDTREGTAFMKKNEEDFRNDSNTTSYDC